MVEFNLIFILREPVRRCSRLSPKIVAVKTVSSSFKATKLPGHLPTPSHTKKKRVVNNLAAVILSLLRGHGLSK